MAVHLDIVTKEVKTSIQAGIATAHQRMVKEPGKDYRMVLMDSINNQLNILCRKMPMLMYNSGISKSFKADAKYNVRVNVVDIPLNQKLTNTREANQNVGHGYKINFRIEVIKENETTFDKILNNTGNYLSDSIDYHQSFQILRKVATTSLAVAKPFEEALTRASKYGPPKLGSRPLVIFEKKIFGQRVIYTKLFEMDALAAGKVAGNLKMVGRLAGGLAIFSIIADVSKNGMTTSSALDLTMTGLALTGAGTGVASTYFIINGACMVFLHKDIGQLIDGYLK